MIVTVTHACDCAVVTVTCGLRLGFAIVIIHSVFTIVIATAIVTAIVTAIAIAIAVEVRLLAEVKVAFMGGEVRWGVARCGATFQTGRIKNERKTKGIEKEPKTIERKQNMKTKTNRNRISP